VIEQIREEDTTMTKLMKRFETLMAAAAFAEEGEFQTARQILREAEKQESQRPTATKRPSNRPVLRAE
jgi:hypothetical protein